MRQRPRRILTTAFVVFVASVFALFFGRQQGTGSADVGEVDGQRLRRDIFEAFREQHERALEGVVEGLARDQQRELIDGQTLDALVRRQLLSRDAEALGLSVTNPELNAELRASPSFQREGRFDREIVEQMAAGLDLPLADLLEELRTDTMVRKLERFTTSPVRVSRASARWEHERRGRERSLRYAVIRTADFSARAEPEEGAAQALVAKDPERVRARYQARRAEFEQAEQVHARHILFTGDDAQVRASGAAQRLAAGEPFDKLARELSADPATAPQGGDLGWFPRGILPPALDAAVFDTLAAGQTSAPIETERGWHLIELEEERAAQSRSFEEVSGELAREILVQEKAEQLARATATRVLEAARTSKNLAAAAEAEGLAAATTGLFHLGDPAVPGLDGIEGLIEMGFALDLEQPVAPRLFEKDGAFYVVSLVESRDAPAPEADADLAAEVERLTEMERSRTAALWYGARRRALDARGGLTLYPLYDQR